MVLEERSRAIAASPAHAVVPEHLLAKIRDENLGVYRASLQRLREDVGQEAQIAQDYRGRLVYELLQNADDAMASVDEDSCVRFELTNDELWVSNSGRPLDEGDVRGLCGISASTKALPGQKRRASIGHKGMGFKSVLEVTDAPEVYSTSLQFAFSPEAALESVQHLLDDMGTNARTTRAPTTRFPWPIERVPQRWHQLRADQMNTAFRFPLRSRMTPLQRDRLAQVLRELPLTALVFLKHVDRVEVSIERGGESFHSCWSVQREVEHEGSWEPVPGYRQSGRYRVTLTSDAGAVETFLVALDMDVAIGPNRGGLDEFTWEGIEETEVAVATRMRGQRPIPLEQAWRRLHVFLPTGEPCPYDLLVNGAFSSNLSRQEVRVEHDGTNYNHYLLARAASLFLSGLLPTLLRHGATVAECLSLLDRRTPQLGPCSTAAAQTLHDEMRRAIRPLPLPLGNEEMLLTTGSCVVPPLSRDEELGSDLRTLLPGHAGCDGRFLPRAEFCSTRMARILVDHGADQLTPEQAARLLADPDVTASVLRPHQSGKLQVDPILSVLERLWRGLEATGPEQLITAVRKHALFPVGVTDGVIKRVAVGEATCFYPPRSLHGEVPLTGLCFLPQELCWGELTPKDRNIVLRRELDAWKALFDVREFKFPEVMRASVLPHLERDGEVRAERVALRSIDRLAAICQLAGRTPDAKAPLPYQRLKSNRALFNLSRLDVPCRGSSPGEVKWVPAHRAYFGDDWPKLASVETVLRTASEAGAAEVPKVDFVLGPSAFSGALEKYRHLQEDADDAQPVISAGEDEVATDEDDETALSTDDQARWREFLQWLGVSASLRAVHFHDVGDHASGWLSTWSLRLPTGWAFEHIPSDRWRNYVASIRAHVRIPAGATPYFYEVHDLEHLVALCSAAGQDPAGRIARALFEHLSSHWATLEPFSRASVAVVEAGSEPGKRQKPPRAQDSELQDAGPNFWLHRLKDQAFCPTGHGPRLPIECWLPTPEVDRRFLRARTGTHLVPTLAIDPALLKGKPRGFAQALGIREELGPTTFTAADATRVFERLRDLFQRDCEVGRDLQQALREVIRPAYRHVLELLRPEARDATSPLAKAPVLATDGSSWQFRSADSVFFLERRETRDRVDAPEIWTFVVDAEKNAKSIATQVMGMRVLENELRWNPMPGEVALDDDGLARFRAGLWEVAPYLLARTAADRAEVGVARADARRLRTFIEMVELVQELHLSCTLDGRTLKVGSDGHQTHVKIENNEVTKAMIVWGEQAWPLGRNEAETLAVALCDVLGAAYFESFIALLQSRSAEERFRILRRAGAPLDLEEKRQLLESDSVAGVIEPESPLSDTDEPRSTTARPTDERPAMRPPTGTDGEPVVLHRVPLYGFGDLELAGLPLMVRQDHPADDQRTRAANLTRPTVPTDGARTESQPRGFGGGTDLEALDRLGMAVALQYEQKRLHDAGHPGATVFDPADPDPQTDAAVFDVSTYARVAEAQGRSETFRRAMDGLHGKHGLMPGWPGFDILTLDPASPDLIDRMIELKSSGVASRVQNMTWNEWKAAKDSRLRDRYFLYLVGNLRKDLDAVPFIRTLRDPFGQLVSEVQQDRSTQQRIQLLVDRFREAEHLELTVRART